MSLINTLRPAIEPVLLSSVVSGLGTSQESEPDFSDFSTVYVSGVTLDSSDMEPGWIFVAVDGLKHHGLRFAPEAVRAGAVAVVTDRTGKELANDIAVPVIAVEDPRQAAGRIASRIYGPYVSELTLVAVTGTNGKTTTTYLVRGALSSTFDKVALMGTVEIDVGKEGEDALVSERTTAESPVVYRALAVAAQNGYAAAVVEASSHALSLHRLAGLKFDSVIFTNLQHDHLDFYGDMANYFEAKAQLFTKEYATAGVVSLDDKWGRKLAEEAQIPIDTVSAFGNSTPDTPHPAANWEVIDMADDPVRWGIGFELKDPGGTIHDCFCPLPGKVNVQNSALALACAAQMGVPIDQAITGLACAVAPPGRMEVVPTIPKQPRVLVDYAHTPEALEATLTTLRPLVEGELVTVFGTDGDRDASKREDLAAVAALLADRLWITDENPRTEDPESIRKYLLRGVQRERPGMEKVVEVKTSRRDAIRKAILAAGPGDLVVILGKGAEPYQEIDGVMHAHLDSAVAAEVTREVNLF